MFSNILIVCIGNICRSPTGEKILKTLLPNKTISSAGLAVDKCELTGKAADKMACTVACYNGISLEGHAAQQLTPELCAKQDLILVMESRHIDALTKIVPEARGKIMLFGHWINSIDIPDPYGQSRETFEHSYNLIELAAQSWVRKL